MLLQHPDNLNFFSFYPFIHRFFFPDLIWDVVQWTLEQPLDEFRPMSPSSGISSLYRLLHSFRLKSLLAWFFLFFAIAVTISGCRVINRMIRMKPRVVFRSKVVFLVLIGFLFIRPSTTITSALESSPSSSSLPNERRTTLDETTTTRNASSVPTSYSQKERIQHYFHHDLDDHDLFLTQTIPMERLETEFESLVAESMNEIPEDAEEKRKKSNDSSANDDFERRIELFLPKSLVVSSSASSTQSFPGSDFFSISDRITALKTLFDHVRNLERDLTWNPVVPSRMSRGFFLLKLFSNLLKIMPFSQVRQFHSSRHDLSPIPLHPPLPTAAM